MSEKKCTPGLCCVAFAIASALLTTAASAADALPDARFKGSGKADPIRVTNVTWKADIAAGATAITFDLAWDWSWRAQWVEPVERTGGKDTLKLENWDAAWVFVKFRAPGDVWRHATLDTDAAHHAAPSGVKLDVGRSDDPAVGGTSPAGSGAGGKRGMGVFVYRASPSSGSNDWKGVTLRWRHPPTLGSSGATGTAAFDPITVELKVFAVQMVYVPTCAFWAGDGAPNDVAQFSAGDTTDPLLITGEGALTLGGANRNNLGSRNSVGAKFADDFSASVTQTLPAAFPKGYAGFYCMRQEITQGQYVDFLNTLTYEDQARAISGVHGIMVNISPNAATGTLVATVYYKNLRNQVKIAVPGVPYPPTRTVARADGVVASVTPPVPAVFTTDMPYLPFGLSHSHQTSLTPCVYYAAWAGLRPMTELEYEKACRGPLKPVPGEFAWGTARVAGTNLPDPPYDGYALRNTGLADEQVVWEGANAPDARRGNAAWGGTTMQGADGCYALNLINGMLRAGIFATPNSDRVSAGASYWGIMELTGNVWEEVIPLGNFYRFLLGESRGCGRLFAGTHGNGNLDLPVAWEYRAQRGGAYDSAGSVSVSMRLPCGHGTSSMRGVRSAP